MDESDINALTRFDDEVARGLVHTSVYAVKIAAIRMEYDAWVQQMHEQAQATGIEK